MADQVSTTHDILYPEAVEDSMGGAYWFVDDCRWPDLDEALADLLAPPIVVCTAPLTARAGYGHRVGGPRGVGTLPSGRR
jgi:hypothetical protein